MKKSKLISCLTAATTLGGAMALTNTACSSSEYKIIVSRDVNFIGASPKQMQEGTEYEQNIFMPVPVMITKGGEQLNVTKVTATTDNKDIIKIGPAQAATTNTFTIYGKEVGTAKINISAETDNGVKMSTSINVTVKPFDKCGYIRYTSWEDFFVWADEFKDGIFPIPKSELPVQVTNTPAGLQEFLHHDYITLGMLTEGTFLAMFTQLAQAAGSATDVQAFKTKWDMTGGQLYWRTTNDATEFMYGLEIKDKFTELDCSYAQYGNITKDGFEFDSTYTEGNVSNITTFNSTKGPQKINKFDTEGWTITIPDYIQCWQIEFQNDEKSAKDKDKFYLYIPYRDFNGEKGINIKSE